MTTIKRPLSFLIICLMISCRAPYSVSDFHGTFSSKSGNSPGNSAFVYLTLKADNTFELKEGFFEFNSICTGTWKIIKENEIELKCYEDPSVLDHISAGYMTNRKRVLKIVNGNQLAMGNIYLVKN
jgi:hypothetical protein